jgi:hypothetical protein
LVVETQTTKPQNHIKTEIIPATIGRSDLNFAILQNGTTNNNENSSAICGIK